MKHIWAFGLLLLGLSVCGQDDMSRIMEDQAELEDRESEEDLQLLQRYKQRPLDLNLANAEDMAAFPFLHPLQVEQLMIYRKLAGDLVSVRELQAVPGWDPSTIRKLLPYVRIAAPSGLWDVLAESGRKGAHQLLLRSGLAAGSSLLLRYHFRAPRLQISFNTEKDGGEKFWQGQKGISFASAHVALRELGSVRQLILGDFLVNMGQGLVIWQGRSVRKTGMPIQVKRQLPSLQPYRSNDENRYMRGIALQTGKGRFEAALFFSRNLLDANTGVDTVTGYRKASSFIYTGYHRTQHELEQKNAVTLSSAGTSVSYSDNAFRLGANVLYHHFSLPIQRAKEPYNLFAAKGRSMLNYSLQYQHTWRNMHSFGELAFDREGDLAALQGVMISADPRLDISLVFRSLCKRYRSFQGSAFTESSEPANETGLYMGLSLRATQFLTIDAYTDHYRIPWLAYRADAPGAGRDHLVQISIKPDKQTLVYFRFRSENETAGFKLNGVRVSGQQIKTSGRFHIEHRPTGEWEWRCRLEINKLETEEKKGWGSLFLADLFWSPDQSQIALNGRFSLFSTSGYDTRIYAFENDVMFYNIVPAFHGSGGRVYINVKWKKSDNWQVFLKMARDLGERSSNWNSRFQVLYRF